MIEDSSSVGEAGAPAFTDRWQLAMEAGGVGAWECDPATDELWWSPRTHEIVGVGSAGLPATLPELFELIHTEDRADARACLELARHGHQSQRVELRLEVPGVPTKWLEVSAMAVFDAQGAPVSMVGTVADVTERAETALAREQMLHEERRARSEAEAVKERMQFLIRAAREVRAVLDPAVVRRTAVELGSQHLGEWSLILDPLGQAVEAAAGDDIRSFAAASGALALIAPTEAIDRVIATGDAQLSTSPANLVLGDDDSGRTHIVEASSIMAAPLALGSTTVGIIVAGHGKAGRPYQAEDLELFGQYAESVAATLVKATLFEERSATARALQQSLLPASLPEIDGIEIGTGYVPVGEGLIVGGDFYDVFRVSDGRFAFAIGDVSGKGSEAAAVTALVRHSIRAFAEIHERPGRCAHGGQRPGSDPWPVVEILHRHPRRPRSRRRGGSRPRRRRASATARRPSRRHRRNGRGPGNAARNVQGCDGGAQGRPARPRGRHHPLHGRRHRGQERRCPLRRGAAEGTGEDHGG